MHFMFSYSELKSTVNLKSTQSTVSGFQLKYITLYMIEIQVLT